MALYPGDLGTGTGGVSGITDGDLRDPQDGAGGVTRVGELLESPEIEPRTSLGLFTALGLRDPRKGQKGSPGAVPRVWGSDSWSLGGSRTPGPGSRAAPRRCHGDGRSGSGGSSTFPQALALGRPRWRRWEAAGRDGGGVRAGTGQE